MKEQELIAVGKRPMHIPENGYADGYQSYDDLLGNMDFEGLEYR